MISPLNAKQVGQAALVQLRANDAQTAGVIGGAATDFRHAGHIVKMQPSAVRTGTMPFARSTVPSAISPSAVKQPESSSSVNFFGVSTPQLWNTSSA